MEDAATRIQAIYVTDLQAQAQAQEEVGPSRKWPGSVLFQRVWVTSKTPEISSLSPFTFSSLFLLLILSKSYFMRQLQDSNLTNLRGYEIYPSFSFYR
jgi:hypothetical protein